MINGHEKNGHHLLGEGEEQEIEKPWGFLTDAEDHEILMTRDAHFGGSFKVMLDYYLGDKIGVNPTFDIDRIRYLAQLEEETGQNLAALLLSAHEVDRVAKAREGYRKFKAIYEIEKEKNPYPRLIADLILSEEEEPKEEIEAIVREGKKVIPYLLQVIESDEAYDPLFPAYGYAPYLAIVCLAKLKAEEAIKPLFEMLSRESIFEDEGVLEALREIGESAKEFLLRSLKAAPFTKDNLQAAYALSAFVDDIEVPLAAFRELKEAKNWEKRLFCSYLISLSLGLKDTPHWDEFVSFSDSPNLPAPLREELLELIREFE